MSLVLSVDVGTTNLKVGIINSTGNILSYKSHELPLERPEKYSAEHNPEKLYRIFVSTCRQALQGYEDKISLIVISAYQLGLIVLDKNKKPLTGIITLQDTRANEITNRMKGKIDTVELYKRTGCPPLVQYPFYKILWLKEKKKHIFSKSVYFCSPKDYLIYRLTNEESKKIYTEPSIASATGYFNIYNLSWDKYALEILGIKEDNLPTITQSEKILCELTSKTKKLLGIKSNNCFLLSGVYDGGSIILSLAGSNIYQTVPQKNIGIINIGTTAMLRCVTEKPVLDRTDLMRFQTYYLCSNRWIPGTGLNNAGSVLKWLRDNLVHFEYVRLDSLAKQIKPGSDGLVLLPFLTSERDIRIGNYASGVVFGLKQFHTKKHILRSILESIGYLLRLIKDSFTENRLKIDELRLGGAGAKSDLLVRIISDILNLPVRRLDEEQASLVGSAMLGYVALGKYKLLKEASEHMIRFAPVIYPDTKTSKIYTRYYEFFKVLLEKTKDLHYQHYIKFG